MRKLKIFQKKALDMAGEQGSIGSRESNSDGGPGSGRFPKGSGGSDYAPKEYKKALIGATTSDGKQVKGVWQHAMDRVKQRNIYPSSVKAAITKGTSRPGNRPNRTVYERNGTRVVFDDSTNEVVTAIYLGKGKK